MSLVWSPYFLDDFERAVNGVFNPVPRSQGEHQNQVSSFRPRMDVHESTENNLVTATFELPGLKKDDITIDVHNGRLTVSCAVNTTSEETKDGYVVRERRSGKFSRVLSLPQGVKAENIKADLNDGILTVTFPKVTEEQQAKRIAVN